MHIATHCFAIDRGRCPVWELSGRVLRGVLLLHQKGQLQAVVPVVQVHPPVLLSALVQQLAGEQLHGQRRKSAELPL